MAKEQELSWMPSSSLVTVEGIEFHTVDACSNKSN